jgi:hypothetical protein
MRMALIFELRFKWRRSYVRFPESLLDYFGGETVRNPQEGSAQEIVQVTELGRKA